MYILKWYHFIFYSNHFHFLRFSKFAVYSHVFMVKQYSYFSDHFLFFLGIWDLLYVLLYFERGSTLAFVRENC